MARYIIKRLLLVLLVLWLVATLTYFMVHVTPGDTAEAILVSIYGEDVVSPETLARVNEKFDLNRPIIIQYLEWLKNAVTLNFGVSYKYEMPVTKLLFMRLPNTLLLGFVAFAISVCIAIPLGIHSALHHNKAPDHATRGFVLFTSSFPTFWIAIMLIIIFAIKLGWVPVSGMKTPNSIILPAVTLAIGMIATTTRMMRSSMLDVLNQDYMTVVRLKGLTNRQIIWGHALRNAILPIITVLGLQIGHILGGSVVVESVFAWPGVGSLFLDAINSKDLPMIEGCVILITFGYAIANVAVDIIYAFVDPRVKYDTGAKK